MLDEVPDWNGQPVAVGRSRGGVLAVADVRRNLLWDAASGWPPDGLKPKLKASGQIRAFEPAVAAELERGLGFYCDLQSLRSEDAITWSFFGPFLSRDAAERSELLNWLVAACELEAAPSSVCEIALWRRLPHPDTGRSSHGPEPDFALIGDQCIVLGEAKWGAREDTKQGVLGDTSQMDMRRGSLLGLDREAGRRGRTLVALGIVQSPTLEPTPPDAAGVATRILDWTTLGSYPRHPCGRDFARYLDWKKRQTAAA